MTDCKITQLKNETPGRNKALLAVLFWLFSHSLLLSGIWGGLFRWLPGMGQTAGREISAGNSLIGEKRGDQADLSSRATLIWVRLPGNTLAFTSLSTLARLIWFDHGRDRAFKPIFAAIAPGQRSATAPCAFDHGRDRAHKPALAVIAPGRRSDAAPLALDPVIYRAPKPPSAAYLIPAPAT